MRKDANIFFDQIDYHIYSKYDIFQMKKSISMKLIEVYLIFALVVITYSSAIPKPGEDKKNRVHEQVMLLTPTLYHYLYLSM